LLKNRPLFPFFDVVDYDYPTAGDYYVGF